MVIGLISDTHGLLRPEAVHALQGVEMILHAGDIGDPHMLTILNEIAPTQAILGNIDKGEWTHSYPETLSMEVHGHKIFMLHDRGEVSRYPEAQDADIIICGHSHKAYIERLGGQLIVNPGGAGKKRFSLPITVAKLFFEKGDAFAELIKLAV